VAFYGGKLILVGNVVLILVIVLVLSSIGSGKRGAAFKSKNLCALNVMCVAGIPSRPFG
jgi:hypothetical protein